MVDRHVALAATRLVKSGHRGDAFEDSRFARPVLANDDGDRLVKLEAEVTAEDRQAEWINVFRLYLLRLQPDAFQEGGAKRCFSTFSRHDDPSNDRTVNRAAGRV